MKLLVFTFASLFCQTFGLSQSRYSDKDRRTYEYLHQLNRRAEFRIIGLNGVIEKDNDYFLLKSQHLYPGQIFKDSLEFRFPLGQLLTFEDYVRQGHPGIFDSLVSLMKINSSVIFQIKSHTDSRGSAENNLRLTEKRSIEIAQFFLDAGVSNHQLRWKGCGENLPLTVYLKEGNYNRWKPKNERDFEKIELTEEYINQFRTTDKSTFEKLHQMNRRTDIVVAGYRN